MVSVQDGGGFYENTRWTRFNFCSVKASEGDDRGLQRSTAQNGKGTEMLCYDGRVEDIMFASERHGEAGHRIWCLPLQVRNIDHIIGMPHFSNSVCMYGYHVRQAGLANPV